MGPLAKAHCFCLVLLFSQCANDSKPAVWNAGLVDSSVMQGARDWQFARGIIHLPSPYSYDACDNRPRETSGEVKEDCLLELREALCKTKMDFAALTDHDSSLAD